MVGITPAWAGKSCSSCVSPQNAQDYPRVGGEELRWPRFMRLTEGLPPRGRGRASDETTNAGSLGITPAWAGKRTILSLCRLIFEDYPRVGGEEFR